MIFSIVIKYIIVSAIICFLYGLNILSNMVIQKFNKNNSKGSYLFQLWSLVLFLIVWYLWPSKIFVFKTYNVINMVNIGLILISIIPTSIIVYKSKVLFSEPLKKVLNGASMEIPQRLLVQNLFVVLGINKVIYGELTLAILLNAVIWLQFIIIQEIMTKKKVSFEIMPDIIASFWFSIWVGILYSITGNIVITMFTHGLQKLLTYILRKKLKNINGISL
mgnify:CR=1 FL=1